MSKIALPALSPAWQRANQRAAQHFAAGIRAERIAPRVYRVQSASHAAQQHTVTIHSITSLVVECDCEAGARGLVCYHASLVVSSAIRRIHELSRQPKIDTIEQTVVAEPPAPAAPARKTPEEVEARMHKMFAKPAALRDR